MRAAFLLALLLLPAVARPQGTKARQVPGMNSSGTVLLPNQWRLDPAGDQVAVGDFPVNIALHPGGKFAAVLNCGYGRQQIVIVDYRKGDVISTVDVNESFQGVAFSADGNTLFCSGAGDERIDSYQFRQGFLSLPNRYPILDAHERGVPAGLAVSAKKRAVYAAVLWGQKIARLTYEPEVKVDLLPLDGMLAWNPKTADDDSDEDPSITKRADVAAMPAEVDAPYPYCCLLDEERDRLYVSLWGSAAVQVIEASTFKAIGKWATEEHPAEMVLSKDGKRLFVANANRNSVSVLETESGKSLETLVAELTPQGLNGNTPCSLALAPDGKRLYVANSNINAVSVFDVSSPGRSRSLGFIPVGWYPTCVRISADGNDLLVTNGKGIISKANRNGPRPGKKQTPATEYIGGLLEGTLEIIPLPRESEFESAMGKWTARAHACMPDAGRNGAPEPPADSPIPTKLGDPSPIKYVIYIIKENRTYDQVLGDVAEGNGDAALCLFPEKITPNHHALARRFVLLDNFYVNSEVSADGHEWSMGAYATDFVEKTWRMSYGHNDHKKYPYPSEGHFHIASPTEGYLWDRAKQANISYRSYGEFVDNAKRPDDPGTTRIPALRGHIDPLFRSFDVAYPDILRADRFISELHRFEGEGGMPRLQIVRLPNDHTAGASAGYPTPTAYLADNDLALGRVVEAVSKSKFWGETALFVVEDDAQNGPDHVDAHRTIAYVISPYARHAAVDSTLYSTTSMLRTMELILGLKPMSQFDAAAMPMYAAFQAKPDLATYETKMPQTNASAKTEPGAFGTRDSARMDFSKEDAADDATLNRIIWGAVRGAAAPLPGPVRAAFVRVRAEADGD